MGVLPNDLGKKNPPNVCARNYCTFFFWRGILPNILHPWNMVLFFETSLRDPSGFGLIFRDELLVTLPETNLAPENGGFQ